MSKKSSLLFSHKKETQIYYNQTQDNMAVLVFKSYRHTKRQDGLEKDIVEKAVPGKRSKGTPVIVLPQ